MDINEWKFDDLWENGWYFTNVKTGELIVIPRNDNVSTIFEAGKQLEIILKLKEFLYG